MAGDAKGMHFHIQPLSWRLNTSKMMDTNSSTKLQHFTGQITSPVRSVRLLLGLRLACLASAWQREDSNQGQQQFQLRLVTTKLHQIWRNASPPPPVKRIDTIKMAWGTSMPKTGNPSMPAWSCKLMHVGVRKNHWTQRAILQSLAIQDCPENDQ